MRRLLILHLVCINLIAAAWIAVFIVHRRSVSSDTAPAEATGTARDQLPKPLADPTDPALIERKAALEAEVANLLERVTEVHDDLEAGSPRIQIPMAFFDSPAHFLSPFIEGDTAEKFRELLQMDETEIAASEAAIARAIETAREFERAHLATGTNPEGFPAYRIQPWGELGEEILDGLRSDLAGTMGTQRSNYFIDSYVIKQVLRKQDESLEIVARPAGGDRAYPSVQVRVVSPPTGASDAPNYMVWLTGENPETGKFVARYGDLLGVGSVEELAAQVGSLPQPE